MALCRYCGRVEVAWYQDSKRRVKRADGSETSPWVACEAMLDATGAVIMESKREGKRTVNRPKPDPARPHFPHADYPNTRAASECPAWTPDKARAQARVGGRRKWTPRTPAGVEVAETPPTPASTTISAAAAANAAEDAMVNTILGGVPTVGLPKGGWTQPPPAPSINTASPLPASPLPGPAADAVEDRDMFVPEFPEPPVTVSATAYVPQDGEVGALRRAIKLGQPALLVGPPGCGKTALVEWLAEEMGRTLVTILGDEGVQRTDMIGRRNLKDGATVWSDGLVPQAMRVGSILYLDEPNRLPRGLQATLFSLLDHRRSITLAENGNEVVQAAPGFAVLSSMNDADLNTNPLSAAYLQRHTCVIHLDYLPADREAALLVARTQVAARLAGDMVTVAARIRTLHGQGALKRCAPCGTRTLLAWAERVADGEGIKLAAQYTVEGLAQSAIDRKALRDAIDAELGGGR